MLNKHHVKMFLFTYDMTIACHLQLKYIITSLYKVEQFLNFITLVAQTLTRLVTLLFLLLVASV